MGCFSKNGNQMNRKIFSKSCMIYKLISWSLVVWHFDFWLFGVLGIPHPLLSAQAGSPMPPELEFQLWKALGFFYKDELVIHSELSQGNHAAAPVSKSAAPPARLHQPWENRKHNGHRRSGALLHPPQKLSCWAYCKMLTEHCRVHRERDEKSADLWVPVQFLASVSLAYNPIQSPTCPMFPCCLNPLK